MSQYKIKFFIYSMMNKLDGNPLTLLLNFIQDLGFLILPSFCKLGCQYRMYIQQIYCHYI